MASAVEQRRPVTVRTRKEPQPATGGKTYHVYPIGLGRARSRSRRSPDSMSAYYMGSAHSDYQNAFPPRVQAGRHHPGARRPLYQRPLPLHERRPRPGYPALEHVVRRHLLFDRERHAGRPIVIKAAGDGEVIFDGDGAQNLFNLMAANYNYFEGHDDSQHRTSRFSPASRASPARAASR